MSGFEQDPHQPIRRIVITPDTDVLKQLEQWSASSGRSIEDIALQLLHASVRVMGDLSAWPVDPPAAPPTSDS